MKHWSFYRGKPQGKNFHKQITSLQKSGLNYPQIARRLNEKYARYNVKLSSSVICKEVADINDANWPSQSKAKSALVSVLSSAWNKEGLRSIAA